MVSVAAVADKSAFVDGTDNCLRRTTIGFGMIAAKELCNWTPKRVVTREQRTGGYKLSRSATAVGMRLR